MSKDKLFNFLRNHGLAEKADKGTCKPSDGESEKNFMSRCITHMMDEKGKDQEAALGACTGIWNEE